MKKDILKIAGVKSEKEFYKKFPSEEAFMKVHGKAFKKAAMGTSMVNKQLTQLTDFSNPPQAYNGEVIGGIPREYQLQTFDPYAGTTKNNATYNQKTGMFNSPTRQVGMADTQSAGFTNVGNRTLKGTLQDLNANDIQSGVQMTSTIGSNIQKISGALKQKKEAKQLNALAPVIVQASGIRPEQSKRNYVRPEDMAFGTQEMGQTYGSGTNYLAKNGMQVGGNLTEIQNTYAPGSLYDDLGYEPLSDSEVVKQYKRGGLIPKAMVGMDVIQEGVNTLGDIGAGIINIGTNQLNKQSEKLLGQAAFQSGMQGVQQDQYSGFMEDGGEVGLKYLSHDWQPQVIAKFGDYDVKDLLKDDPTMDTLRAGGHLGQVPYTPASSRAMSTERPRFAMGGELQTHWGGEAEPISYNPYLPGDGETVMFKGQSHEESDGQGRTGIGVTYGNNPVEVERGEPAVKLQDGGEEESLVVYGNMKIPSYGVSELGDLKAKGKKFKSYANDLSKIEARQNKIIEKATDRLNSLDPNTSFEKLEFDSLSAMIEGANMKQKGLAIQKQRLAGIQNAILDTAKEQGLDSDALAKGNIKKAKDSDMAKFGGKFTQAQVGILARPKESNLVQQIYQNPNVVDNFTNRWSNLLQSVENRTQPVRMTKKDLGIKDINVKAPDIKINKENIPTLKDLQKTDSEIDNKFGLMDLWRQVQPYTIPSNQQPLDPNQLTPEMYALAMNQLEPVQAQTFEPLLEQPYSVSLQDQLNANQADFNALQRQVGYNPAALSQLAAQKYSANSAILGQQARINQEMQMGAFNRNRGVLNDAALKNLSILDQQYQRQSQAKSATKAQAQSALSSIADKIAKNKLENRTLGVYENMYNYRFGPKGRAINVNAPADFNIPQYANLSEAETKIMEDARKIAEKRSSKKESNARNGSIVKAIKNL